MYIESFHIDGFGIFSGACAEALSPGLSIFLGQNEAGKSTCLEFLRVMLTGYPGSNAACDKLKPLRGGQAGGSLILRAGKNKALHLTRRPGKLVKSGGELTLTDAEGHPENPDFLRQLLHGVNADVYRSVFGFSLQELQTVATLAGPSVRDALYGASFGPGLKSPGEVIKCLEKEMEAIFRKGDKYPKLSEAQAELKELARSIQEAEAERVGYDSLSLELEQKKSTLTKARKRKNTLDEQRRLLQRRLDVWQQWNEWRMTGIQLDRMAAKAALLDALPVLTGLLQHKSSFVDALKQLPDLTELHERAEEGVNRALTLLGEGWSCERIRNTNRSLFAREDMEKQAWERSAAVSAHQAAVNALKKANSDVQLAEREIEAQNNALSLLPMPVAALNEEDRDILRRTLDRIEAIRLQLPDKQRVLQKTRAALAGACEPLRLSSEASVELHQTLDNMLACQDEARALADEVQKRLRSADEAAAAVSKSEDDAEKLKGRMAILREERHTSGSTREDLDRRAAAMRSLRTLSTTVVTERDRLLELDNRLATEQVPSPVKSLPLIVIGVILILLGGGMLVAHWQFGLTDVPITDTLVLPVSLWSGYLVLACGAAFLAGGLPRSGPEAKRYKLEIEQLQGRRETSALHVAELEMQAHNLCAVANVDNMDHITLDAAELLLERERENCITGEFSRKEMDTLRREMLTIHTNTQRLQVEAHEREGEVQQIRRRWHEFMLALHVATVPSPENAVAYFAKAEAAHMAYGGMKDAKDEVNALENTLHVLEDTLRAVPAVAEALGGGEDCKAVEAIVCRLLESCKEADAVRDVRIKTEADLQNCKNRLEHASILQKEAVEQECQTKERVCTARNVWNTCLGALGLGEDLEPETVRNAFTYMENCLTAEGDLKRAQAGLAKNRADQAALREPLSALLKTLERTPALDANGRPDWVTTLDMAQKDAVEASEAHKELVTRRQIAEDALHLAAGHTPFEEFLASFSVEEQENAERRMVSLQDEYNALQDEEQNMAAQVAVLDARITSLANADDLAELRQRQANLQEEIQRMDFDWSRHALAREMIIEAKKVFERERQPHVIRDASEIFKNVTGGRWRGISISLDDASLNMLPAGQGEPLPPEVLSRGAQEQAYLALRLAYIKNHASQAQPLPLIMDEVLVNFDPKRAQRTARAFVQLTEDGECPHQLLYFTCQPHTVDVLRAAAPDATLFHIEDGRISRA